ncbi:MAG: glycosyltransferase family 2 protein [Lachnospiraceae bacterium]|nr:glycosyltransferase family 2 protein [Lachnospiraceae bacterium]
MEPEVMNQSDFNIKNEDILAIETYKQQVIAKRKKVDSLEKKGVSILIVTNKLNYIDNIFANIERSAYPKKEFLIILNNNDIPLSAFQERIPSGANIRIFKLDETVTLGDCLNFGVRQAQYDYVGKMDDDDYYGANYLLDQMNLFYDPQIDVVSISNQYIEFEGNNSLYVVCAPGNYQRIYHASGATIIAKKSVFDSISFQSINCDEDRRFFMDCVKHDFMIYCGSNLNYIYKRHAHNKDHTFQIEDEFFLNFSRKIHADCNFEALITA